MEIKETSYTKLTTRFMGSEESVIEFVNDLIKIIGRNAKTQFDQQIEEVVVACSALSRERTGALIVFEKYHGLLNYSSTGTRLDSRVHSDIIYSIFQIPIWIGCPVSYLNL
jgi:diadenylate cyclase